MMNVQHETAVTVHENLLPGNQRIWQCFATRYKIYSELRNFCKLNTLPTKMFFFSFQTLFIKFCTLFMAKWKATLVWLREKLCEFVKNRMKIGKSNYITRIVVSYHSGKAARFLPTRALIGNNFADLILNFWYSKVGNSLIFFSRLETDFFWSYVTTQDTLRVAFVAWNPGSMWQLCAATMSWVGWLLELFILFAENTKLYTPSTLNIEFIQWHTQLIMCAVK